MADENDKKKPQTPAPAGGPPKLDRRDLLMGLSTVPALGLFGYAWNRQQAHRRGVEAAAATPAAAAGVQELNIALIGAGAQGQVLMEAMLRIPGLRFRAVCDIWTEYNQRRVVNTLKRFKQEPNGYEDYREMLDKEKELDAVIIATPDFWHAQHTIDCLKAGKHVYCEKEMSNTLEGARSMVMAQRETGKLLQIGHQRRSNPRYIHAYQKLLGEAKLLGRIVTVNGQWNRAVTPDLGAPERYAIPADKLKQYGFKDMHQFRNWRWYKGKGGGPIVDLGSHQIDIYNWFLGANPSGVMASGGLLYYEPKTHEWYDTVMVIFDYDTPLGPAKAYYQTQTTNGSQGYYESFMGDQGTLLISESEVNYPGLLYRDPNAPAWDEWIQKGYVSAPKEVEVKEKVEGAVADVRESVAPDQHSVPVSLRDPYHQPHLQNFFDAVRGKGTLNCPAEIGYESAVSVLKVNEAIEAKSRLAFKPEDFKICSQWWKCRVAPRRARRPPIKARGVRILSDMRATSNAERRDASPVECSGIFTAGLGAGMESTMFARGPMIAITVLRVLVGWHFFYEGLTKLSAPSWSAAGFLKQAKGPLAGSFHAMAAQPGTLANADLATMWLLTLVGACLILGLFTRLASLAGIAFLLMIYLAAPPWIGYFYAIPSEGSYLIVNKNLVEVAALAVIMLTGSGRFAGLDRILSGLFRRKPRLATA